MRCMTSSYRAVLYVSISVWAQVGGAGRSRLQGAWCRQAAGCIVAPRRVARAARRCSAPVAPLALGPRPGGTRADPRRPRLSAHPLDLVSRDLQRLELQRLARRALCYEKQPVYLRVRRVTSNIRLQGQVCGTVAGTRSRPRISRARAPPAPRSTSRSKASSAACSPSSSMRAMAPLPARNGCARPASPRAAPGLVPSHTGRGMSRCAACYAVALFG